MKRTTEQQRLALAKVLLELDETGRMIHQARAAMNGRGTEEMERAHADLEEQRACITQAMDTLLVLQQTQTSQHGKAVAYLNEDELQAIADLAAFVKESKLNVGHEMKEHAKIVATIVRVKEQQRALREGDPLRKVPHAE